MREILFRGKTTVKDKFDAFNNIWVCGDLIQSDSKYYIHPHANRITVDGELGHFIIMHEVIPETVGQYTGLRDKNGTKIFEGDIVKIYDGSDTNIGVVEYDNKSISYLLNLKNGKCYAFIDVWIGVQNNNDIWIKRIGNIHDNPELLEVE